MDDLTLVADDKEADAFGPVARDMKIKNLRTYLFIDRCYFFILVSNKMFLNFYSLINWLRSIIAMVHGHRRS